MSTTERFHRGPPDEGDDPVSALSIGFLLSSEENGPRRLVEIVDEAVDHGFDSFVASDHFHPWIAEQGHSPMIWAVLGAIAARHPHVALGTGVTCPTTRIHPAIVAQAAATTALLCGGRFFLGVGTGENLNEHICGDRWPPWAERADSLAEAVEIIRALWTGETLTYRGTHHRVEDARLFDHPPEPSPIYVSGYGPKAVDLAARIGDGFLTTAPDAEGLARYRAAGGQGPAIGTVKVCWATDRRDAAATVHRLWPTAGLPGELGQELRTVAHFEQAVGLVDEAAAVGPMAIGPDPQPYLEVIDAFARAGFDELHIGQIGPDQSGFLDFFDTELRGELQ